MAAFKVSVDDKLGSSGVVLMDGGKAEKNTVYFIIRKAPISIITCDDNIYSPL